MESENDESLTRNTSSYWGSLADVLCDHVERFVGPKYVYTAVIATHYCDMTEDERQQGKIFLRWTNYTGLVFSSFDKARQHVIKRIKNKKRVMIEYHGFNGYEGDQHTIAYPGMRFGRPPAKDVVLVLSMIGSSSWNSTFLGVMKIPIN